MEDTMALPWPAIGKVALEGKEAQTQVTPKAWDAGVVGSAGRGTGVSIKGDADIGTEGNVDIGTGGTSRKLGDSSSELGSGEQLFGISGEQIRWRTLHKLLSKAREQ
ncbi:unnamed protein product [Ilex paraguariensis]|uniref:Uncharacterized protein n=1 Tax=Ilex paraguariensis TaxID=185542 RepID=A0ABC8UKD0_9AQUA